MCISASAGIPAFRPLFKRMLSEMIDLIPANNMPVGMDTGSAEVFYGITLVTREIIAKVLVLCLQLVDAFPDALF